MEGTYYSSDTINLVDNILLKGSGWGTTINAGNINVPMIRANAKNNVHIEDLTLYGSGRGNNQGIAYSGSNSSANNVKMENVGGYNYYSTNNYNSFTNSFLDGSGVHSGYGVYITGNHNTFSNNMLVNFSDTVGIRVESHHVIISNNILKDFKQAIDLIDANYSTIINNNIFNNTISALNIVWSHYSSIIGNNVDWTSNGILLSGSGNSIISNNIISNANASGITMQDLMGIPGGDCAVIGNVIIDYDRENTQTINGLYVGTNRSQIAFNRIKGEGKNAIYFHTTSHDNIYQGNNLIDGYAINCVDDSGTNNIWMNNHCGSSYINYNPTERRHELIIDDVLEYWLGNTTANFTSNDFVIDDFFFVDESLNRVGIGTLTPSLELDVVGGIEASGNVTASDFYGNAHYISNATERTLFTDTYNSSYEYTNASWELSQIPVEGDLNMEDTYNITNVPMINMTGGMCIKSNTTHIIMEDC